MSSVAVEQRRVAEGAAFSIILALGFSHFLNDTMQSLLPALYPILKSDYGLSFAQIGLITLTQQVTDRKSTRLNQSHSFISYAVFCLKKKKQDRSPIALRPCSLVSSRPGVSRGDG